jgi:hypothetical protein
MLAVPKGRAQVKKTFGDPDHGGKVDEAWAKVNLVSMPLPYPMRYAYDTKVTITHCQVHHLIVENLEGALQEVWDTARFEMKQKYGFNRKLPDGRADSGFYDAMTLDHLRALGLDLFGGTFVFRPKHGSSGLSMHAYGIAIDIDPAHNAQYTKGRMPKWVVAIFKKWGFTWGGTWKKRDDMHFQYATGC